MSPAPRSDPSQSDPETKDFWLNMAALTEALLRQAEQNPAASYYNLVLLRYQVGQAACDGHGTFARLRRGQSQEALDQGTWAGNGPPGRGARLPSAWHGW